MAELRKMGDVKFGGSMNQAPPGKGQTGGPAGIARSKKKRPANFGATNAKNMKFN